jgi:hypothetical protein
MLDTSFMLLHGISLKTFVVFYSFGILRFVPEGSQGGRNCRFTGLTIESMAIYALELMNWVPALTNFLIILSWLISEV